MKIVIDVSENFYAICKEWVVDKCATIEQAIIAGGIPLKQGEWIPISERLPKEDNDYLVTYVSYGARVVSKSWFNTRNGFIYDNVIAWQPLPEPYKKGGAE